MSACAHLLGDGQERAADHLEGDAVHWTSPRRGRAVRAVESLGVDEQVRAVVDGGVLAGQDHRGGVHLLDDGRSGEAVAAPQSLAAIDRRGHEAPGLGEVHVAFADAGLARIGAGRGRQHGQLERLGLAERGEADVHDLDRLVLGGVPVHALVLGQEGAPQRAEVARPRRRRGRRPSARSSGRGSACRGRGGAGGARAAPTRGRASGGRRLPSPRSGAPGRTPSACRGAPRACAPRPAATARRGGRARTGCRAPAARGPAGRRGRARGRRRGAGRRRRRPPSCSRADRSPCAPRPGGWPPACSPAPPRGRRGRPRPAAAPARRRARRWREPASSGRSAIWPSSRCAPPRRPRTTLASVTVACAPPRP